MLRQADIAIVVVGATSGESVDRPNLTLERSGDELVEAVAAVAGGSTIVLMQICGAVLMPWKNKVGSILSMFLGGEATGSAWAQVLFGDVSPSGRLPIMMPETESDSIAPSDEESLRVVKCESISKGRLLKGRLKCSTVHFIII